MAKESGVIEPPPLANCPLCGGKPKGYRVGTYGLIRCWACNLRLECKDGLEAAIVKWNEREERK